MIKFKDNLEEQQAINFLIAKGFNIMLIEEVL